MEAKINIAEILKDKPVGTKLHSPLFGKCTFLGVYNLIIKVLHHGNTASTFYSNGTYFDYPNSEPLLFPSKEMRDWSKFAWKKGDVLVSEDNVHIIFEYFENDDYKRFKGKHYFWKEGNEEDYSKEETKMLTSVFKKASDDEAQTYINTIEERLGGKLNRETLEIEKQSEFKDGDIVSAVFTDGDEMVCVFKEKIEQDYMGYCGFFSKGKHKGDVIMDLGDDCICNDSPICKEIRLATEKEKQQLFDALAKEGKAWNAEKKEIMDLKPKVEFKPFDKVLVRDCLDEMWRPSFFACYLPFGREPYQVIGGEWVKLCIPYEGNESLLGTTKDVEG